MKQGDRDLAKIELREAKRFRYSQQCFCPKTLAKYNQKINSKTFKKTLPDFGCVDDEGYNFWAYTNRDCIIRPDYVKWCNQFLCDLSIAISIHKKQDCDIKLATFLDVKKCGLSIKELSLAYEKVCMLDFAATLKTHGCEMAAQVFLLQNFCDVNTVTEITEHTCELAYEAFIKQCECNIDIKTFKKITSAYCTVKT